MRVRLVTAKGLLIAYGVIALFSIVLGFIGGKFHLSNALPPLVLLSAVWLGLVTSRLPPGPLIELRDDAIVRTDFVTGSTRLPYKEIDSIRFDRNWISPWNSDASSGGQKLTNFDIRTKGEVIVDDEVVESSKFSGIGGFIVPHGVDVEKVLQILRRKDVTLIEQPRKTDVTQHAPVS